MIGGRGSYRYEFDHYERVPQNIEQRVIDTAKQAKGDGDGVSGASNHLCIRRASPVPHSRG